VSASARPLDAAQCGYCHDGRFASLSDVVTHYDAIFSPGLAQAQKADLVEYLKSL
jgi:cytochrome c peroxidase